MKSLYKKELKELKEVKDLLETTYKDIIEKYYYSSNEFNKFKTSDRVKELDNNFEKIMKISLLNKNGFIRFLETRKGNIKKD